MARGNSISVSSLLFESFDAVPTAWNSLCKKHDLGMDPRILSVFQRTLKHQCRCWGIIVFDADNSAIGCAALCLFTTELIESCNPRIVRWRNGLRQWMPDLGRIKVLFCGLPVPSGSTHIRIKDEAHAEAVVTEVHRTMQKLVMTTGAHMLVFKELDDMNTPLAKVLLSNGYASGIVPPMHILKGNFDSFEKYCAALKSRYRSQVKRSQKKLRQKGFEVLHGRGRQFFSTYFNHHVHQLYVAMHDRAKQKLERMPASFFLELAHVLDNEALLTLIRRNGKIYAFSFSITRGRIHYNLYSGLDYEVNNEGDLYFNLFYNDLDQAFRANATEVHLGQTSDIFKSRLGTALQNLYFFARAPSPVLNYALRLFAPIVFPKVMVTPSKTVFAADGAGITY